MSQLCSGCGAILEPGKLHACDERLTKARAILSEAERLFWERAVCAIVTTKPSFQVGVEHSAKVADAMVLEWRKRFAPSQLEYPAKFKGLSVTISGDAEDRAESTGSGVLHDG
jgi:hypothetical protein